MSETLLVNEGRKQFPLYLLLFSILFVVGAAFVGYSAYVSKQHKSIESRYATTTALITSKGRALNQLQVATGFGGFIHNFKNYILRADQKYYSAALEDLERFDQAITEYHQLPLTADEKNALLSISETIGEYRRNLDRAKNLILAGEHVLAVDNAINVTDDNMIVGLGILGDAWAELVLNSKVELANALKSADKIGEVVRAAVIAVLIFGVFAIWLVIRLDRQKHALIKKLADSDAKFRSMIDSSADAIITITDKGIIETFNKKAMTLFGYSQEEVIGRNISLLVPPNERHEHDGYLQNSNVRGPKIINNPRGLYGAHKDGTVVPIELNIAPYWSENKRQFVGIIRDIEKRQQLEDQLRQSQRLEAVGQLTGGIAHDFNNLLGIMIGNVELLALKIQMDQESTSNVDAIVSAIDRATSLVARLLAFSRKQSLSPEPTDIAALVAKLKDLLERSLGKMVSLHVVTDGELCSAIVDPNQLDNALINLALNARDAMINGGNLTIATTNVAIVETHTPPFEDMVPGDYVRITVSDNGSGMSPEVREKAFEPFFTTKDVGEGSGLGLSMVFGFVRQSNGHISISSEVGVGTTFTIYLPALHK